MKTVWGLTIIVVFAAFLFGSVSIINNHALSVNSNLNEESVNMIGKYDQNVQNLTNIQNDRVNTAVSSNSTNNVEAFFREYAESKNNYEKFKDGIEYIWDLPEIILLSVPLLDEEDTGVLLIAKGLVWFLISVLILLVGYKAIRTGKVDEE